MKTQGYATVEKLKSKKQIELLFNEGEWKTCGPLKIRTLNIENQFNKDPIIEFPQGKFSVSVSKRFFKKAVDRNRIKRLMREAYRLNKPAFHKAFGTQSINMLFWNSSKMPTNYHDVEKKFLQLCESNQITPRDLA